MNETEIEIVNIFSNKIRIDKLISSIIDDNNKISRTQIQRLIIGGYLRNEAGKIIKDSSYKCSLNEKFFFKIPHPKPYSLIGKKNNLNIIFEDDYLIVLDKEAGMVVHPAPGNYENTLVHALIYHTENSLSGIGGVLRPGIVHRLDKDTSGLMIVAKNDYTHQFLSKQFSNHTIKRSYKALIWGVPQKSNIKRTNLSGFIKENEDIFKIERNISRHLYNRKKMSVSEKGKYACTRFTIEKIFENSSKPTVSLINCWLETGRTHQIRVHLNYIGNSVVGDKVYGEKKFLFDKENDLKINFLSIAPRHALHAFSLGFQHPLNNETMYFESQIPNDMKKTINFFNN